MDVLRRLEAGNVADAKEVKGAPASFSDCPYGCVEGKVFNTVKKKFEPCPHCTTKKEKLSRSGIVTDKGRLTLPDILNFGKKYMSDRDMSIETLLTRERVLFEKDSIDRVGRKVDEVISGLEAREYPSGSICFGLGLKGDVERLAYGILGSAYRNGYTVGRFISVGEFGRAIRFSRDRFVEEIIEKDIVVMLLQTGFTSEDESSARSLLQQRGMSGKCTVLVTNWQIEACSGLLTYIDGEDSYYLAKPYFVEYKSSKEKKHSDYINGLLGVLK